MCGEKGFAEDRVRNGAKKLLKGRQGSTQGRLDTFFKVMPTTPNAANGKRKSEEIKNGNSAKKAKGAAGAKKGFFKRWPHNPSPTVFFFIFLYIREIWKDSLLLMDWKERGAKMENKCFLSMNLFVRLFLLFCPVCDIVVG